MIRRTLLTAAVMLFAGALAPWLPARAGMDPATFINNLGHQLQLVTSNTSTVQRLAGFRELFHDDFDVPGLGRFVLGRFWRILTPSEQQEFLALFENYVVYTYSDRLSEYASSGSVLRVTGSRLDPDGAIVSSEIIRGSGGGQTVQPIKVDWRLTACNGGYKISDIIIDGLSMAVTGRSQLEGVAERNGGQPQAILAVMRQESANAALRQIAASR
jgi:phospholipid transport system substrate-binding protein